MNKFLKKFHLRKRFYKYYSHTLEQKFPFTQEIIGFCDSVSRLFYPPLINTLFLCYILLLQQTLFLEEEISLLCIFKYA